MECRRWARGGGFDVLQETGSKICTPHFGPNERGKELTDVLVRDTPPCVGRHVHGVVEQPSK